MAEKEIIKCSFCGKDKILQLKFLDECRSSYDSDGLERAVSNFFAAIAVASVEPFSTTITSDI